MFFLAMGKVMMNHLAFIYLAPVGAKPVRGAEEEHVVTELCLAEFGAQLHMSNPHIAVQRIWVNYDNSGT